jgi:gliding motility-associated-like protein
MKAFIYIFLLLFAIIAIPTASYADGDDDDEITDSTTDTTTVIPSKLEMPNAFSPNNDGFNDEYQAKSNYQNITEFRAMIFNRWGQCLYTWTDWTDPKKGWDGTYKGKPVKDGVYFVRVKAKGGDGKEFDIRKDVNLLRKFNVVTGGNEQ